MRHLRSVLVTALAFVLVISMAGPAFADELQTKVNAARTNDLSLLAAADRIAQQSAAAQAAAGTLSHANLDPLLNVCSEAGEVVGEGGTIDAIFTAFRASPLHWQIITASNWTSMGTGVAAGSDGTLYVSIVFCQGPSGDESTTAPPAPPVTIPSRPSAAHATPHTTIRVVRLLGSCHTSLLPSETGVCPGLV